MKIQAGWPAAININVHQPRQPLAPRRFGIKGVLWCAAAGDPLVMQDHCSGPVTHAAH